MKQPSVDTKTIYLNLLDTVTIALNLMDTGTILEPKRKWTLKGEFCKSQIQHHPIALIE